MSTLIFKIQLPDSSSKAVKLHDDATIHDARNAILNRLDQRISRQDFRLLQITEDNLIILKEEDDIRQYSDAQLLLKRIFLPRYLIQNTKQEFNLLAFQLVQNIISYNRCFQNAAKICAMAFVHFIGDNFSISSINSLFNVSINKQFFKEVQKNQPACDVQNAEQLLLKTIAKEKFGFSIMFKAGIVQQNNVQTLQKCVLTLQEEGIWFLSEIGKEIGHLSYFQVKRYGRNERQVYIETDDNRLWLACLQAEEAYEIVDGWIRRIAAQAIVVKTPRGVPE